MALPLRTLNNNLEIQIRLFMEFRTHRETKVCEGWARAGPEAVSSQWHLWSESSVESGEAGPPLGLTREGWACQMESGSGRWGPRCPWLPWLNAGLKRKHPLPPSPAPNLGSSGPLTRPLPKILTGVPSIHHPHSLCSCRLWEIN